MELSVVEADGYHLIRLSGRLDTAGVSRGETRFAAVASQAGRRCVVDLSDVTFLASLGVRMFISTGRILNQKNGRLILYSPTDAVREVIETTALDDLVPVAESEDAAVALALA